MTQLTPGNITWLILYLICVIAVVAGLTRGRNQAVESYGTESAQREWDDWRATAGEQTAGEGPLGPVQRRVPRSEIPPALALMNDHFVGCLVFSLIMTTALFATTMFLVRGIFSRPETTNKASGS